MGTNTNVNAHVNTLVPDRCTRVVEDVLDTHTQTHTHTHANTHAHTHTRHGEKQKSTRRGDDRGGRSTENDELAFVSAHDLERVSGLRFKVYVLGFRV